MAPDPTAPLLQLTYRADLNLLVGRWSYQPDPARLPAAYQELTRQALASGCPRWLQDIRRRAANDPATTHWLLSEYLPDMARRLGSLRVAYLISPSLLAQLIAEPDFKTEEYYTDKPYQVRLFNDEGAAVAWLSEQ